MTTTAIIRMVKVLPIKYLTSFLKKMKIKAVPFLTLCLL